MQKIEAYLQEAIDKGVVPGAVFSAGDGSGKFVCKAYGRRRLQPEVERMTPDTLFDLASLTKIVSAWTAVVKLLEQNVWQLDASVGDIDPCVRDMPVGRVTIGQLLTHTGGLPERTWLVQYGRQKELIYRGICERDLDCAPGTHVAYSNRGFILLGFLVEKAVGRSLDRYVMDEIWKPAGMMRTLYNPSGLAPIAPTEFDSEHGGFICGTVHDENARALGGVAGHAGVFSDVDDLGRFCTMIVNGGEIDGKRILSQKWIEKSFYNYTSDLNDGRGLGWQKRPGDNGMYRHFGFTGTAIWIDPECARWAVLLTNRVHPDRERYAAGIQEVRAAVQNLMDE